MIKKIFLISYFITVIFSLFLFYNLYDMNLNGCFSIFIVIFICSAFSYSIGIEDCYQKAIKEIYNIKVDDDDDDDDE